MQYFESEKAKANAIQQLIDQTDKEIDEMVYQLYGLTAVTFDCKDYADDGKQKQMTLSAGEFIRRFEQHILPQRFCKIRTYGYLANRNRHQRINEVFRKMKLPLHKGLIKIPLQVRMLEQFGVDMEECSYCKSKTLKLVKVFYPWQAELVRQPADDG